MQSGWVESHTRKVSESHKKGKGVHNLGPLELPIFATRESLSLIGEKNLYLSWMEITHS